MPTKTFRAATMQAALNKVRRALGGHAIVLQANERSRRAFWGLGPAREQVEVVATSAMPGETGDSAISRQSLRVDPGEALPGKPALRMQLGDSLGRLHDSTSTLARHGSIQHLIADLPEEVAPIYAQLLDAEVPESIAKQLSRRLVETLPFEAWTDSEGVQHALLDLVGDSLHLAPPIVTVPGKRRVVALVGPTGVGKTTTLAKLAATLKLSSNVNLALITVDTYRIAALEQLRTYAEIIGVPVVVAADPTAMRTALDRLSRHDLILIDTAGRSPRDVSRIQELAEILEAARPDETHLVMSATASMNAIRNIANQFEPARADRLILTKLDEASGLGVILAVQGQVPFPLSYVTTGQSVPDDIEAADRARLAAAIARPASAHGKERFSSRIVNPALAQFGGRG